MASFALINLFRPCNVSLHCKGKTRAKALKQLPLRAFRNACRAPRKIFKIALHEANFPIFMVVQNSRKGFTLLELIVVLIIISLMSALVAPKLVGPMSNLDLKTASQKVAASLRYARSRAASEKTTCTALFDFDKNRLIIVNSPLSKEELSAGNAQEVERILSELAENEKDRPGGLRTYHLPDGIKLTKGILRDDVFDSGYFRISFFPGGNSSGGEILLGGERGKQFRIAVDFITGIVRLSEVAG